MSHIAIHTNEGTELVELTSEEETQLGYFKDQSKIWDVSHQEGCIECKGTYYYKPIRSSRDSS